MDFYPVQIENFLSEDECDFLMHHAESKLESAFTVDSNTGEKQNENKYKF